MARNLYHFEFHPEAIVEARRSTEWYEERSISTAARFQEKVMFAERQITMYPERWPEYLHGTRHYLIDGFPYGFVYLIRKELVLGVAVAHLHRRPGYWRDRLEG